MTLNHRLTSSYISKCAAQAFCFVFTSIIFCGFSEAKENLSLVGYIFRSLAPEECLEKEAALQYELIKQTAQKDEKLAPPGSAELTRIREISKKIISLAVLLMPSASRWNWEVNLLTVNEANAFCMPGGKILFFTGLINGLNLSED